MFQRVADEDGEAAVGRVSSKWSSGELKLYYSKKMCLCSVVFACFNRILCTGSGRVAVRERLLGEVHRGSFFFLVFCVSE